MSGRRRDLIVCAALVALVLAIYGQTVGHAFIGYDDPMYVAENPIVQRGLTWEGVRWAFTNTATANYHPVTWLSHLIDSQLFGPRAGLHHLSSAVLHAAAACALYLVMVAMTAAPAPSALVAMLFAVHPMHVESVAWVAERKDVLCALSSFLTIGAHVRYVRRRTLGAYLVVATLFALALLSKPMAVTLPAVLVLLDRWPLRRTARLGSLLAEKVPLLAMAAAVGWITVLAQGDAGAVRTVEQFPLGYRASNATVAVARYLGKTVWPANLAVFYPSPARWPVGFVTLSAAAIVLLTAIAIAYRARRPWLLVGWLWFLGMLVPVIGLVQVGRQSMADRYSYLPHVGLFVACAWTMAEVAGRGERARKLVTAGCCAIIALYAAVAFAQARHWKDTGTLFGHALEVTADNALAHNMVGNVRVREKEFGTAEAHYQRAVAIDPRYALARLNLANLLASRKRYAEAVAQFEFAIASADRMETAARAHLGLAVACSALGDHARADAALTEAVRLDPRLKAAAEGVAERRRATTRPTAETAAPDAAP